MHDRLEDIYNFLPLSDRVATGGQPTSEQYRAIAAAGYGVVVNLALNDSSNALENEDSIARALGIEYIHIPVVWDAPTLANFQEFVSVMDTQMAQKIFVHCAANKRVLAFLYLYRLREGVEETTAKQDLAKIWTPNRVWQDFIDTTHAESGSDDSN